MGQHCGVKDLEFSFTELPEADGKQKRLSALRVSCSGL